jgi:hypothetical protein
MKEKEEVTKEGEEGRGKKVERRRKRRKRLTMIASKGAKTMT